MLAPPLPSALPLREDLRLYPSAPDRDGSPVWVIQDPVSNRFYKIGWFEYECLLRWPGDPAAIAQDINQSTPFHANAVHVQDFATFLESNRLVRPSPEGLSRLKQQANAPGWRHWKWWLQNYLFFRVPVLKPDRLLRAMLPWVSPLFTRTALWIVLIVTLIGLSLVMREWDVFTHSVLDLITPSGILGFALALIVTKTLHELGHALVATRQGVRVGHMGVAFLVLWPMLYTDTGESWRLTSHRQRLAISVAGVSTELALAGLATFAWALLDDGLIRQAMLYTATTAWILSVALNISPFMRFDGYYILSDLLGFPNLHERAGDVARTMLRRFVLGLPDPYPGEYTPKTRRALAAFAFFTWIYRLIVFLGIAWMVYALFFKVLGVFLMIVEILWFILRPIGREFKVWRERWAEVTIGRKKTLWGLILLFSIFLSVPWTFNVTTDGVARPYRYQTIYAPEPALIQLIKPAGLVKQNQVLVSLSIPELAEQRLQIQGQLNALENRLAGLIADETGQARLTPLLRQLSEQQVALLALDKENERLQIHADFDGRWLDVDDTLTPGVWINTDTPLGVLLDADKWVVDTYIEQRDVDRIHVGSPARFYFDRGTEGIPAMVQFIDHTRAQHLNHVMLDGQYGGPIPTQTTQQNAGAPVEAHYRVRLLLTEPMPVIKEMRGRTVIEGERQSLLWQGLRRFISVIIRESGL